MQKNCEKKYNGQINLILFRINKIKPIEISQWMEDEMKAMFKRVNKIYDYHKQNNYFFSYPFVLYKLCQLLGIKDYNPKLQKTHWKDEIVWEKICKELNWTTSKSNFQH